MIMDKMNEEERQPCLVTNRICDVDRKEETSENFLNTEEADRENFTEEVNGELDNEGAHDKKEHNILKETEVFSDIQKEINENDNRKVSKTSDANEDVLFNDAIYKSTSLERISAGESKIEDYDGEKTVCNEKVKDENFNDTTDIKREFADVALGNTESEHINVSSSESNVAVSESGLNVEEDEKEKGWRKPKSRTVMPAGSGSGSARSPPHAHDTADNKDEENIHNGKDKDGKKKSKNKEETIRSVLIEGVLFRARYLGSTQLACEGQPTKATRMLQAEEAVSRIKAPEGENQPSTEVDLFISTEKIMVLNTELKEIMMDHALRTISYIADIGDLVVLMARRRFVPHENDSDQPKLNRTPKMICHVFESEEAQFIAQSIGQAFQVAYMEFLKANGIEDHSFVKEMDYQEVLNSQEIFGDELQMFAKKELQKEVVVPKTKGEILGVVVVESGWGSMLPTVVIANLAPAGAAARCGQLNIGDQIIAINGVSLVGLPLSTCQTYIKNSKNQTVVKLTVVPCAPVVEVKIKRPDTKYQLGFSVQNGVICSLLRGGIAERGGVRVGHRIIEINSQSVVAVPHERIVNLLATSVGEILMKTMPTSMFRLLTGQENPVFI